MKKALVSLLALALICGPALADIGVGYETITFLPQGFTFYVRDKGSGWGVKLGSGFGTSIVATTAKLATAIGSLGFANYDSVIFYTLNVTKDLSQGKTSRSYLKLGAWLLNGSLAGQSKTAWVPNIGIGWEWDRSLFGLTTSLEMGIPGVALLGARHYF
jgi:hypothetical protein